MFLLRFNRNYLCIIFNIPSYLELWIRYISGWMDNVGFYYFSELEPVEEMGKLVNRLDKNFDEIITTVPLKFWKLGRKKQS